MKFQSLPHTHSSIVGVDVGGTFTDLVYFDGGAVRIYKLLSTKGDPSVALLAGLDALGAAADAVVSHGTTVATNALLEHKGAATALITTAGFRDVLAIGRQTRPALYRLAFAPRWLPVPDDLRFEVNERVSAEGDVLTPLDEREVAAVLDRIVAAGAESLAVCLVFSFLHPEHEAVIGALAAERGLPVSLSSAILPEFREFERTSTTVLNAYVSPLMARYLGALEAGLASRGAARSETGLSANKSQSAIRNLQSAIRHRFWIMQSSGGILSAEAAGREAVRTLLSGPAAGVTGAFQVASAASHDRVITFDMGGTSTDVSLADGAIRRTSEGGVEGWPVRVPMLDVHTVGAGGGSIAWVDAAGALRVGPQSAGSEPGPACYGREGMGFTVTDANLLLGRLDPAHFLGGRMNLNRLAAELAADRLAEQLGLTPVELAEGVIAVANARMEQAIRVVSVERGFDPRGFTLLPFGGAGPMHALELADALHIGAVLAPRLPGVLSALGLVLADFTRDFSRTLMRPLAEMTAEDLAAAFAPLAAQAQTDLAAEGFTHTVIARGRSPEAILPDVRDCFASYLATASFDFARQTTAGSAQDAPRNDSQLDLALDLRYRGQSFELTVPIADCDPTEAGRRFHAAHEQRYGYARPEAAVELVNVRLTARGLRSKPELPRGTPAASPDPAPAQVGWTGLRFGGQWLDAPIYERSLLAPGHALAGPALIVQEDATTVLIPGWRAGVDPWLNLLCRR